MAAGGLHISISAEKIFSIGDFAITNSMFTSLLVSAILIGFAVAVKSQLTNTTKPTGLQNFAEAVVEGLYNLVHGITGDQKRTRVFLPVISSFFLFILLNNWLGLFPGVGTISVKHTAEETKSAQVSEVQQVAAVETKIDSHDAVVETQIDSHDSAEYAYEEKHEVLVPIFRPGTADLNTTLALAIVSVFVTQAFGLHFLQLSYLHKFFNFSSPIMFFVGILELISEFAKIVSFAFRLFGNIFAGEVLLVVMAFLAPLIAPMPFYGLEIFVGFIQALVFSLLSLVFFNMATHSHDEH